MSSGVWKFVHVLFSVSFAATVLAAHWNALGLRRASGWSARVALLETNHRTAILFGIGSLLLLGVLGNLAAGSLGYRMAADSWLRWANGLWLLTIVWVLAAEIPATARLRAEARRGAQSDAAPGYDRALATWRMSNALLLLLNVAFIGLMVFHWRS